MTGKGEYRKGPLPAATYTPIPTLRLNSLTEAVARIDSNVRSVKNDLLPPLTSDTKEARDKAREALVKIDDHLVAVDHSHGCTEGDRQRQQDRDISSLRELFPRVGSLSKFFWVLVGILVTGVSSAVAFALVTKTQAATNATRLEAQAEVDSRHDELIRSLRDLREADRREFVTLVKELPRRVVEARASVDQVDEAADSLPLTPNEKRLVETILRKARRRGEQNGKR